MSVIAVIFDFDDTLAPDSTSQLLDAHGIDAIEMWATTAPRLVAAGYDPPLAYLNCLLDWVGPDRPLGPLTNTDLAAFGAHLDPTFFPGLPALFDDLRDRAARARDVTMSSSSSPAASTKSSPAAAWSATTSTPSTPPTSARATTTC